MNFFLTRKKTCNSNLKNCNSNSGQPFISCLVMDHNLEAPCWAFATIRSTTRSLALNSRHGAEHHCRHNHGHAVSSGLQHT